MSVRAQLGIGLALVACAVLAGYLLGRRPDPAQERRIGELVEQTRQLEAERQAARTVADSALTRAAHSDSAARAALARADRLLRATQDNPPRPAVLTPDSTSGANMGGDLALAGAEITRLREQVDTLAAALTDTRNALERQLEAGARLREAVVSLTDQSRRDSLQIQRLQTELTATASKGSGLNLSLGGGWKRAALFVGAGFIAGAIVTR